MTITLAAVFMALLTAALLLEEASWRRRVRKSAAAPRTLRCLCCVGAPLVDDMATHSRLAHGSRVTAVEDSREWAS